MNLSLIHFENQDLLNLLDWSPILKIIIIFLVDFNDQFFN